MIGTGGDVWQKRKGGAKVRRGSTRKSSGSGASRMVKSGAAVTRTVRRVGKR
ncbi:hypothetical protein HWB99_gp009 [Mycobacterium phage DrLupo]|uniref:Uncharacterized protein n=1 Tax=Mycobacterium phage DrLupo TaxID=2499037 RepID=A0A3S9UQI5_9CAUD|nr:hypothetical protein HWB99_gp009 [Mycobacterium phage DrLupo]AZS12545.1 hypothetical protein SEA_DRLUPO_9 [Mycobacterium phage DrLupo]